MERVRERNLCIPGYTPEEIVARVEAFDRANAMTLLKSKVRADVVIAINSNSTTTTATATNANAAAPINNAAVKIRPKPTMPRTPSSNIDLVALSLQRAVLLA
jgi:hypothetical protein